MKLSIETKKILKNFAGINQSLHIKKTKDGEDFTAIATICPQKSIVARVKVAEKFDHSATFYDINQFISSLPDDDNEDTFIELQDNFMTVKGKTCKTKIVFADENVIVAPKDTSGENVPDTEVTFTLSREVLVRTMNSARKLGLNNISFKIENGNVTIFAKNKENNDSNTYEDSDITFVSGDTALDTEVFIKSEYLMKLLPGDYTVELRGADALRFISKEIPSLYYTVGLNK